MISADIVQRIRFLDGLRGVAILLVILFHAFTRWPNLVPYAANFSAFPLFKFGWLGVELFFMISGFVIVMTLERGSKFTEFIAKRWLRLFPAMLVASILILASGFFLHERPLGIPRLIDSIPGLLFIEPQWLTALLRTRFGVLDGAFWSLFVEVKFYIVFGILFVTLRRNRAILSISMLFMMYLMSNFLNSIYGSQTLRHAMVVLEQLSFQFFGWFSIGAAMHVYHVEKKVTHLVYSLILGILSSVVLAKANGAENFAGTLIAAMLIAIAFIAVVANESLKKLLELRLLLYFGFISYPLYLLHQNSLIAMIIKLHKHVGFIPGLLLPLVPVLILVLVSDIIARWTEPWLKNTLKRIVNIRS